MSCNGSEPCPDFIILILLRHKFAATRSAGVSVYVGETESCVATLEAQKIKQLEIMLRQNLYALRREDDLHESGVNFQKRTKIIRHAIKYIDPNQSPRCAANYDWC